MKRTVLATFAAAVLSASAAAQSDQQPTHAEQVQHWAEVGIDAQLKSMKAGLRLSADQDALWGPVRSRRQGRRQGARGRPAKGAKRQLVADGPQFGEGGADRAGPSHDRDDGRRGQTLVRKSQCGAEAHVHYVRTHACAGTRAVRQGDEASSLNAPSVVRHENIGLGRGRQLQPGIQIGRACVAEFAVIRAAEAAARLRRAIRIRGSSP